MAEGGGLANRRENIRFPDGPGLPDSMAIDRTGHVWVAHWDGGRLSRFDPSDAVDRVIALPVSRMTNCAFTGPKLDRLFVTSAAEACPDITLAGVLFEVDLRGARGVPQTAYPG